MAIAEELQILVNAKVNGAIADLKKVSTTIDGTGKSTSKLSGLFKQLAGPLAIGAVIAGSIKMGKEFSKAASNAEEIESKFRTVYRSIGDKAEESAQRLADSFDLADSTAQELLGTTGDLLTGLGFTQSEALGLSEQVNTLAVDLASFSNYSGGASGASEALTKALLGESEMAKGLGIVINQNTAEYKDAIKYYTEVEGKTLLQAKAYTALQFATEQSGNAIGDYQRTSESTANVQRRLQESTKSLKEELGAIVNEGITPLISVTDTIVSGFADWVKQTQEIRNEMKAFEAGTATAEQTTRVLNNELIGAVLTMSSLNDAVKLNIGGAREAVEAQKERIAQLKIEIGIAARSAALDAQYADAKKAQDEAEMARIEALKKANDEKIADMDALTQAFSKTTEGQKQALEAQIAFFETFVQGPKAIAVLADLKEQLAGLTEESINLFNGLTPVAEAWKEAELERIFAIDAAETAAAEHFKQLQKEKMDMAFQFANASMDIITAIADYQSATGDAELQRMIDAGASEEELDKKRRQIAHDQAVRKRDLGLLNVAIDTASAIVGFLVNPGGVAGIALSALAGATGAIQAAAISSAPIPAYATGGSFVANQATPIMVGEGGGSERVTVEPIGGGDSGGNQSMILSIDGQQFSAWMQSKLDNGGLRIPRRVIV